MRNRNWKRSVSLMLSIVLLFSMLFTCIPALADTTLRTAAGETIKTNVIVRESNTTSSRSLTVLSRIGTAVVVLGEKDGWYQVQVAGVTGYIRSDLMKVTKEGVVVKDALKKGDKSEAVKIMQEKLIALNYLSGSADGVFGAKTQEAVIAFQRANGLTADGEAGDKTLKKLMEAEQQKPQDIVPVSGSTLRFGMRNDEVAELQTNLKKLGYFKDHTATGYFGSATKDAVIKFQQDHGLKADGVVGVLTLTAIQQALNGNPGTVQSPTPAATPAPTTTPETYPKLSVGSTGDSVKKLQNLLIGKRYLTGSADGVFGPKTETAVKNFQSDNGIEPDGVVGEVTWKALENTDTVTSMKPGDKGAEVTRMQKRLIELGYMTGTADGSYGNQTTQAVKLFQTYHGLAVDGVAGSKTLEKLYSTKAVSYQDALNSDTPLTLREGMENEQVKEMQLRLIELKYLSADATGKFGSATLSALKLFQTMNGLTADGVAGPKTLTKLNSPNAVPFDTTKRTAILEDWWSGFVNANWARGTNMKVTDVATGKSYWVKRKGGTNHVDAEPLTKEDTAIMEELFGHKYSWTNLRGVVIWLNGVPYAAAQNFMPHGECNITDNNFDGHFCMHFLNSRTHGGNAVNPNMQEKVMYAYEHYKG